MRSHPWILALALVGIPASGGVAQEVTFGGQVRPRYEFRDPVGAAKDAFTSMRVRAHVSAALERRLKVFVQIQDVRLWGEETSTLGDFQADNFDLHQGYIEVQESPTDDLSIQARIGRQETAFGRERLIGPVNWTQQGRVFDGGRVTARGNFGTVDVFGFRLAEATAPNITADALLAGAYATVDRIAGGALDLYGIYDRVAGAAGQDRGTVGARLVGQQSAISYRVEGSYQFGELGDLDVSAFMFGARVGASFAGGAAGLTLWYDYLSGDDDPADGDSKVFHTLFATNHPFYGFADLFTNIPVHTGGLGLQDIAVKGSLAPRSDVRLNADVHTFHLAKQGALTSKHLAEEIDITTNYRYSPNLTVTAGFSQIFQAAALGDLGRLSEDMSWVYVMLNATF